MSELILYGEKMQVNQIIQPYLPLSTKILNENYTIIDTVYKEQLSPSCIYLATEVNKNQQYAVKKVMKDRLRHSYMHDFARNEMAIQYSLSRFSNNIVKVPCYFENEDSYTTVMELSHDPRYFEDLLENVIFFYSEIFSSSL